MLLSEIIAEADARVQNAYASAQKVTWLNELNNEFFDIVKIPKTASFTTIANTASYTLSSDMRTKNIEKVYVGNGIYPSFVNENVPPGRNFHLFDDTTFALTLNPAPTVAVSGIAKYYKIATTTFLSTNLTVTPDAPAEYHWIYILGLCEKIAKSMEDVAKANNYEKDYRGNLLIAQQNYQR